MLLYYYCFFFCSPEDLSVCICSRKNSNKFQSLILQNHNNWINLEKHFFFLSTVSSTYLFIYLSLINGHYCLQTWSNPASTVELNGKLVNIIDKKIAVHYWPGDLLHCQNWFHQKNSQLNKCAISCRFLPIVALVERTPEPCPLYIRHISSFLFVIFLEHSYRAFLPCRNASRETRMSHKYTQKVLCLNWKTNTISQMLC